MNSDTVVRATVPGKYKRVKTYDSGRACKCGTILSIYNKSDKCYTCDKI